jgi:hypothetical protein
MRETAFFASLLNFPCLCYDTKARRGVYGEQKSKEDAKEDFKENVKDVKKEASEKK